MGPYLSEAYPPKDVAAVAATAVRLSKEGRGDEALIAAQEAVYMTNVGPNPDAAPRRVLKASIEALFKLCADLGQDDRAT